MMVRKNLNTSQPRESLKDYLKSKHDNETTRPVQEYEKNREEPTKINKALHICLTRKLMTEQ